MSARTSADAASAIVVGAGAFGSAAADALAWRGWAVTVVERYAPANARGSSGDRTRQLRRGHGAGSQDEDLWYIRSAERGIAMWQTQALFPGIAVDDLALAVFEPGAGVIRAQKAVSHRPGPSFDIDRDGRLPNPETIRELAPTSPAGSRRWPAPRRCGPGSWPTR